MTHCMPPAGESLSRGPHPVDVRRRLYGILCYHKLGNDSGNMRVGYEFLYNSHVKIHVLCPTHEQNIKTWKVTQYYARRYLVHGYTTCFIDQLNQK